MVTGKASDQVSTDQVSADPKQGHPNLRPAASNAAIAVIVFVLEIVGILSRAANDAGEFSLTMLGDIPAGTYLILAASSVALLWRKSLPVIVLLVTLALGIVWDVIGLTGGPSLAIFVSLYGVGRYVEPPASYLSVAGAAVLVVVNDLLEGEEASVIGLSLGLVLVFWYLGRRVRGRREYLALVEERAEFMERERAAEARRAVDEERTRIARELHDLVAHRVSMMTVQAGAAQTVAESDPERAVKAMEAVEEAGREALEELRHVVGVLRADDQDEALVPLHGLDDIPDLVAEVNDAGMDVSFTNEGVSNDLSTRVDLASYRIVQESLTNVLKHAGSNPRAEVRLSTDGEMLVIEVTDRGSGVSTLPGSGLGLVGMRERAILVGGTFEAGPRPDGGFRVRARLPLERGPA